MWRGLGSLSMGYLPRAVVESTYNSTTAKCRSTLQSETYRLLVNPTAYNLRLYNTDLGKRCFSSNVRTFNTSVISRIILQRSNAPCQIESSRRSQLQIHHSTSFSRPPLPVITSATYCQHAASTDPKVKVLYDGHCPLCVKEIKMLMWLNKRKQQIEFVDITLPGYSAEKYGGISYDQAMEVMHVIGKDGQVFTRIDAMREMYAAVGWGSVWAFARFPIIGPLTDRAYNWFARNRLWITGRGDECETGTCNIKDRKTEKK